MFNIGDKVVIKRQRRHVGTVVAFDHGLRPNDKTVILVIFDVTGDVEIPFFREELEKVDE